MASKRNRLLQFVPQKSYKKNKQTNKQTNGPDEKIEGCTKFHNFFFENSGIDVGVGKLVPHKDINPAVSRTAIPCSREAILSHKLFSSPQTREPEPDSTVRPGQGQGKWVF